MYKRQLFHGRLRSGYPSQVLSEARDLDKTSKPGLRFGALDMVIGLNAATDGDRPGPGARVVPGVGLVPHKASPAWDYMRIGHLTSW